MNEISTIGELRVALSNFMGPSKVYLEKDGGWAGPVYLRFSPTGDCLISFTKPEDVPAPDQWS